MASIHKRNGSYFIMVSCGYDIHGKQVRRTMTYTPEPGMTKNQIEKEVQRQAILFEEKCKTGQAAESGCMKLSEFIEAFFESHAELNLKKKTIVGYRQMAGVVSKELGHLRLDRITPQEITLFYRNQLKRGVRRKVYYHCQINLKKLVKDRGYATEPLARFAGMAPSTLRDALNGHSVSEKTARAICKALGLSFSKTFVTEGKDKPLSNNTVRHYHSFLSSVLGIAVKWGLIPNNPCERATRPKKEKTRPSSSWAPLIESSPERTTLVSFRHSSSPQKAGAFRGPRSVGSATLSKPTICRISPSTASATRTPR